MFAPRRGVKKSKVSVLKNGRLPFLLSATVILKGPTRYSHATCLEEHEPKSSSSHGVALMESVMLLHR